MNAQPQDFFSDLDNVKPYVKIAFEGFAGTGKTLTAAKLAIGIHRRIQSDKPIVLFDTERAAKFLLPVFEEAGIPAKVKNSRSLADLKTAMQLCSDGFSDVLMIDSISHVWENFLEAYKWKQGKNGQKYYKSRLEFQDWGLIKPAWKAEFSDPFVCDPYHAIFTGRAGYEYDNEINEETKKREVFRSGIKMKVEGETAYEPDLLVLMERFEEVLGDDKRVYRQATVIKDRSRLIDGKVFQDPDYEAFAPAVELILKDPSARAIGPEGNAAKLIQSEEDKREYHRKRDIVLEKIEAALVEAWPGHTGEAKKAKVAALKAAFDTTSWTEIKNRALAKLEEGFAALEKGIAARADAAVASCPACHQSGSHVANCPEMAG